MNALTSRRNFLRGAMRYSLLGAAVVLGRVLWNRSAGQDGNCHIASPCHRCAVFQTCNLPKAGAARRAS